MKIYKYLYPLYFANFGTSTLYLQKLRDAKLLKVYSNTILRKPRAQIKVYLEYSEIKLLDAKIQKDSR